MSKPKILSSPKELPSVLDAVGRYYRLDQARPLTRISGGSTFLQEPYSNPIGGTGGNDSSAAQNFGLHILIVSADGYGQYLTINDALADTAGSSTTNRFCILVAPGRYNETVTLPSFVSLIGICDCQKAVEIYSATGPIITFPNDATNEACVANLWIACRPTTDNQGCVLVNNGTQIGVKNCYLEWTSATNNIAATAIRQVAGIAEYSHNTLIYAAGGTFAGVKSHRAIDLESGQATIRDNTIELTVNDVDDSAYGIGEPLNNTVTAYIKDNRILVSLFNGAAAGAGYGYNVRSAGTTKIVQNNRIKVISAGGAGNGYALYCDSSAGASLIESADNIFNITGFGANYWAGGGAGDSIYSHFDAITAADGKGAGPSYEFVNSPTPGETRVTGDITPDADNAYDMGSTTGERWKQVITRKLWGYIAAGEGVQAIDIDDYDDINVDGTETVIIAHIPSAATKKRLITLEQANNYSDNDADVYSYQRNSVELEHLGNKGWHADKYYNGVATIVPAAIGTADSVAVVFGAALPSANYTVELTGYKQLLIRFGAAFYNVIGVPAIASLPAKAAGGFTINLQWTAYAVATNAWAGSWDNYNAMVAALGPIMPALTTGLQIEWQIRMML